MTLAPPWTTGSACASTDTWLCHTALRWLYHMLLRLTCHGPGPQQQDTGLPPNWEVRHSQSKNLPYYFNSVEKISRWEPPPETDTEKLKIFMARYHSRPLVVEDRQPGKIRAAHLLVKHRDSRRPSSWREVR